MFLSLMNAAAAVPVLLDRMCHPVANLSSSYKLLVSRRVGWKGPRCALLQQVPMTVVRPRDAPLNGVSPLLLTAYGAYGQPLNADFSLERLPLLARGWGLALAHVRGGGELGRRCAISSGPAFWVGVRLRCARPLWRGLGKRGSG